MKRLKSDAPGGRRLKLSHFLIGVAALYLVFIGLKFPRFLETFMILSGDDSFVGLDRSVVEDGDGPDGNRHFFSSVYKDTFHSRLEDALTQNPPQMPWKEPFRVETSDSQLVMHRQSHYGRITGEILRRMNRTNGLTELEKMADEAWALGLKAWKELERSGYQESNEKAFVESCPSSVSLTGEEFAKADYIMLLPCGLAAGSSVTVVGTPNLAHEEYVPQLARIRNGDGRVLISQFKVELQGLKAVDGEDPPRIMHLNPRLKGDWSQRQVIEHNTCYRMQWGMAQRCNGIPSENDADMVDGFSKCEKWINDDAEDSQESMSTSWLRRFIGHAKKPEVTWPFPFVEGRLFVLTIRAGVEGYHINAGGRHVTSFPYRTGFTLEDATGLVVNGDVDVHSIYATSLPISHPSFSFQQLLEMSEQWKSHPLQGSPAYLFIGILSATNHFAERMAIRKTWMQFDAIKSLQVVARFFVALNPRKEINAVLKKEADYFGDIVILPFMDHYELVVLKTVAICEYGGYANPINALDHQSVGLGYWSTGGRIPYTSSGQRSYNSFSSPSFRELFGSASSPYVLQIRNMSAAYIMKCDDDTFVRVDTILTVIKGTSPKKSLYMGNLNLLHTPLRSGKWAVTYEEWPEAVYPPYANGPGYIISSDIARFIISQHANQSLRLFKMEDVSMGMWVEQFNSSATVQYSHNWKFCQYGCMEDYFTAHYQSPRQMICLWGKLGEGQAHCCNFR